MIVGGGMMAGGGLLTVTVAGAEIGVPAAAAGFAVAAHGVGSIKTGFDNIVNDFNNTIHYAKAARNEVPEQLTRGQQFEKDVLKERGLTKNGSVSGGQEKLGESIPDSLANGRITEIKDVQYVYKNSQFRDYIKNRNNQPIDLIVSPQTKVSGNLQREIKLSGGEILVRQSPGVYVPYGK
jgi:hypothetical protein